MNSILNANRASQQEVIYGVVFWSFFMATSKEGGDCGDRYRDNG